MASVGLQHLDRQAAGVLDNQVGAVRRLLHRGDPGPRRGAQCGQQRGLAARPGAQVQPSPGVIGHRRQRERAGHQLAALVLDQGLAVAHRGQLRRITARQVHRIRRIPAYGAVHGTGQLLSGQHSRAGRQVHLGSLVIADKGRVELAGGDTQRVDEGLCDPARVRMDESGVSDRIGQPVGSELVDPGLFVAGADSAQHAVDEACTRRIEFDSGLLDGGGDGSMRVDPSAQQLIRAESKQIEQHRIDGVRRTTRGRTDDRVEQAANAAGAIRQFGGESSVTTADLPLPQQNWQQQVRVGVALAHRPQHIERCLARRIQRPAPRWPTSPLWRSRGRSAASRLIW